MMVFRSLREALDAGFQVYDRTAWGYLVRTRTAKGWAVAVVELQPGALPSGEQLRTEMRREMK